MATIARAQSEIMVLPGTHHPVSATARIAKLRFKPCSEQSGELYIAQSGSHCESRMTSLSAPNEPCAEMIDYGETHD
jgi:hypothetical protein